MPGAAPTRLLTPQFLTVTSAGRALLPLARRCCCPCCPQFVEDELGGDTLARRDRGRRVRGRRGAAAAVRRPAGRSLRAADPGHRRRVRRRGVRGAVPAGVATSGSSSGCACSAASARPRSSSARRTMIADLAPVERRGEAISYWSVAVYSGLAFGPFIGEVVLDAARLRHACGSSRRCSRSRPGCSRCSSARRSPTSARRDARDDERQPLLNRSALAPGDRALPRPVRARGVHRARAAVRRGHRARQLAASIFLLYGVLILVVRIAGAKLPDRLGARTPGRWR